MSGTKELTILMVKRLLVFVVEVVKVFKKAK